MKPCKSNIYSVLYKGVGNCKHYFNFYFGGGDDDDNDDDYSILISMMA